MPSKVDKIILINLPSPALAEPWTNFPLGIGYLAASLEKRNYNVSIVDLCDVSDGFEIEHGDVYGLSISTPQLLVARRVAKLLKERQPAALVIAGGPHVLVGKNDFLSDLNFDAVVIGEGEFSFYELVRDYELYGAIDKIYENPPIKLLDDIPFPARHLMKDFKEKAEKTVQLMKGNYVNGGQTTIIASRGCPFNCSFCAPHSRRLRYRTPRNVLDEINQVGKDFGVHQFKWQDDTFTLKKSWVLELCHLLAHNGAETYHRAHTRVDTFDDEMAGAMQAANFKLLCFGIESFSQEVLDINSKGTTVDQIEEALKIAKKHGFETVGFFIFGMPGETAATVKETKEGLLRNKPLIDYVNLATMVPLVGTPVWDNPDRFNCEILQKDYTKFWIVGHDDTDDILVKTKGVALEEMKTLKRDMYQFLKSEEYARPEWK